MFPLADLRKEEVIKIIETFKVPYLETRDSKKVCFSDPAGRINFVEKKAAPKLREEGNIVNVYNDINIGEHKGVHKFSLGQDHVKSNLETDVIDKRLKVVKINAYAKTLYFKIPQLLASGALAWLCFDF